jgi:hypothetical protein
MLAEIQQYHQSPHQRTKDSNILLETRRARAARPGATSCSQEIETLEGVHVGLNARIDACMQHRDH